MDERSILYLSALLLLCVTTLAGQSAPPPNVVITLNEDRVSTPEEAARNKEQMITKISFFVTDGIAAQQRVSADREFIHSHLRGDALASESSVRVDLPWSEVVNAYGDYKTNQVSITVGLYTYLSNLVAAQVIGRMKGKPECAPAYAAYLVTNIAENAERENKHLNPVEVQLPEYFSERHLDICPKISLEETFFNGNDKWSIQFRENIDASIAFVLMHELAHIRNKDSIPVLPCGRFDRQCQIENARLEREHEAKADDYAIDFFINELHATPLAAFPVMLLIALSENYQLNYDPLADHPPTVERINKILQRSSDLLRSAKFSEWLKEKGMPQTISDSEKFKKYLNRLTQ
jgi:hypothetical protein